MTSRVTLDDAGHISVVNPCVSPMNPFDVIADLVIDGRCQCEWRIAQKIAMINSLNASGTPHRHDQRLEN